MAANVAFVIHGIGRHGPDWAAEALAELETAAGYSSAFRDTPLAQQLRFVPVVYDDLFDGVLARWQQLSQDLTQSGAVLPAPVETLNELIGNASQADNAASGYLGDIVLYTGFRLVRNAVLLRVISTMLREIAATYAAFDPATERKPQFAVIAHSLGTTVAHDALHLMARLPWGATQQDQNAAIAQMQADLQVLGQAGADLSASADGIRSILAAHPASPARFRFDSVFMLANTSRLLYTVDREPYASAVHPASIRNGVPGYCDAFFDVDNKYDYVGLGLRLVGRMFSTDNEIWSAGGGEAAGSAYDLDLEHLHQANAHALSHYLKHPLVYSTLFRRMAPSYRYAHHKEAMARFSPDDAHPFRNLPLGDLEAQVDPLWDKLVMMLARRLKRGEIR